MDLKKIYAWLHSRDAITWCGHFVIGGIIYLLFGLAGVLAAFLYREISDIAGAWARHEPLAPKVLDSFMDLWSPLAAVAVLMACGL